MPHAMRLTACENRLRKEYDDYYKPKLKKNKLEGEAGDVFWVDVKTVFACNLCLLISFTPTVWNNVFICKANSVFKTFGI